MIGSGMALFGPAWQSSVNDQVPPKMLPSAIMLNAISFNIARSFGPAIGGVIVAAAGSVAAFIANAVSYIPVIAVLYFWRRKQEPSRLPPERLNRAIISGVRYVVHSPPMRTVMIRCMLTGALGSSVFALLPLLVRDVLGGGAQTYGVMLGAFGLGAILGAFFVGNVRKRFGSEVTVSAALLALGIGSAAASLSRMPVLTAFALSLAGAGWMMSMAQFNISIQMAAPRWVSGRALAGFRTSNSAGLAIGSWAWGYLAVHIGIDKAMLVSAAAMLVSPVAAIWLRMPEVDAATQDAARPVEDPEVRLALTPRSGPVVVEIEYRIEASQARAFYGIMQQVQLNRQRNGAYGWSIARDVADPEFVDRTLPLPDLARLPAPAQQADRCGAGIAADRNGSAHRARAGPHPPHAGAAVRVGSLEGRYAGCRGRRRDPDPRPRRRRQAEPDPRKSIRSSIFDSEDRPMEPKYVQYEQTGEIVKVTINRPDQLNAISRRVYAELDEAFTRAEEDDGVKVIVVAGAGDHFGAGHDLGSSDMKAELDDFPRDDSTMGRVKDMDRGVYWRMHDRWRNIGKPTIAMVQGYCIMGSWMLAACCDLAIASEDAKFADRSVRWGGVHHEYPTHFFELGVKKAKEFLWTGDFVDAATALRLGMVNHVVPRAELENATRWLAERIALNDLLSLKTVEDVGQPGRRHHGTVGGGSRVRQFLAAQPLLAPGNGRQQPCGMVEAAERTLQRARARDAAALEGRRQMTCRRQQGSRRRRKA